MLQVIQMYKYNYFYVLQFFLPELGKGTPLFTDCSMNFFYHDSTQRNFKRMLNMLFSQMNIKRENIESEEFMWVKDCEKKKYDDEKIKFIKKVKDSCVCVIPNEVEIINKLNEIISYNEL